MRTCVDEFQHVTASDVFGADYLRQRKIGEAILAIANARSGSGNLQEAHDYVDAVHGPRLRVDDDIFFPQLRHHCLPEDNIEKLIGQLDDADDNEAWSSQAVAKILEKATQGNRIVTEDERILTEFAERLLKRAATTKAALFPIACVRFDDAALTTLCDALRALDGETENTMNNHRGTQ